MPEARTIVAKAHAEIGSQNYRVKIEAGDHSLLADEPRLLGGADAGPSPYQLLLSSLGACTAITLRMYVERKAWPVSRVGVDLRLTRSGDNARIDRNLTFEGQLTNEQCERLADVAERTPVTLTLKEGIEIRTTVAAPNGS
jgi:putative redox protein